MEGNMKNVEGYSPKETHELQPVLSHSGDPKDRDWLRWYVESQIQERATGSSEGTSCINNKDLLQINPDLSKAKFDQSLLTETGSLTLDQKEALFKGFLQKSRNMVFGFIKRHKARKFAEKILEEAEQYFDLITCYYRADAGSYTTDANPQAKGNLNHLFEKKTELGCTREFSEKTQKNYNILANEIKYIALCK
jgi:hypothetical protein